MLKIFIADDHRVVREGLKNIVEKTREMIVVAEASDGAEVLSKISKSAANVVLLDISMPGTSGIETLKQLKSKYPKLPVLMLSQYPEDQYAMRALRAGAAGYLTKDSASNELIAAIRKVASGGKYVGASLAEKIASALDTDGEKLPHESLSDREYEILCMLGSGKTVSKIADELALSVKTISTYRTRILEKMKMISTPELILYVVQSGLIPSQTQKTAAPKKSPSARRRRR
jgi:DNA-binding NarL/FixJ family response regulator